MNDAFPVPRLQRPLPAAVLVALCFSLGCAAGRGRPGAKAPCTVQGVVVRANGLVVASGDEEVSAENPKETIAWLLARRQGCVPAEVRVATEAPVLDEAISVAKELAASGLPSAPPTVLEDEPFPIFRSQHELGELSSVVPPEFPFESLMLVQVSLPFGPAQVRCRDDFMGRAPASPVSPPPPKVICCRALKARRHGTVLRVQIPPSEADLMNRKFTGQKAKRCRASHAASHPVLVAIPRSQLPIQLESAELGPLPD
jgi:hypothetical protein